MDDLGYRIAFLRIAGIGPAKFRRLESAFGTLDRAWRASSSELAAAGLDERTRQAVLSARATLDPEGELARVAQLGAAVLSWHDPAYPRLLREIDAAPPLLFVQGELRPEDERALAIVGTRRASPYGRQAATRFARELAERGYTIVSGLARGIDTVAHLGALEAGGRTIAVLGSGIDIIYPAENARLARQITERGALVSEYPPGTKPVAMNFPQRNRIISGLSRGVVVVEGDRRSGALLTLAYALNQNREAFAVPGSIFSPLSDGPNQFIKRGMAKLVTAVEDLVEEVQAVQGQFDFGEALPEDPVEATLLAQLAGEPLHIDDLCRLADLPAATVSATLVVMELKGMVRHLGGMVYARAR